jgi:hypothetical protein
MRIVEYKRRLHPELVSGSVFLARCHSRMLLAGIQRLFFRSTHCVGTRHEISRITLIYRTQFVHLTNHESVVLYIKP